ncbi:substrate-binding domain-containing protein [Pantoea trifolii]|uniref:Substrate-binding domain-containing protein n=1 Tax=Pantoea trifolii TaxID=2968030 RepID=A0ABT1VQQ4_9GAMM|nr:MULTISPECIES: substrate-binding domain-containing protein [unclassified Pantoea]MCQ8229872.1 substrate-binding domain-containing protein [Pantoea sp. MMK2]MCQ8238588.1 substrate-binding domain-containing protein [Pantoea sp. MMK3]
MAVNSNIVGIVSDEFTNPNTVKLLNEVTRQLNARGLITLLLNANSRESYQSALHNAAQLPVSALVFLTSLFSDELSVAADILPQAKTVHLSHSASADANVVIADGYDAGAEMGLLLLSQGHQRFGFMHSQQNSATARQLDGFVASLQAEQKELKIELSAGGNDRELAYQAMMAYLKKTRAAERINALFCESDVLAFGALQAVRDFAQGAHVAVVGFDDVDEARASTWHLTSWAQRRDLLVAEALNRLLENLADTSNAWQQGELQVRHSHHGKHVPGEMSQCGCAIRH